MHGSSQPVHYRVAGALIETFHGLVADGIQPGIDEFQCGTLLEAEIVIHGLTKFLAATFYGLAADLSIHRDVGAEQTALPDYIFAQ